jgi:glutathione S-transferase
LGLETAQQSCLFQVVFMLILHYYPSNASMVPHILLEELAVPYQRVLVDRTVNAHKSADYLRLNPNGLMPVLTDGDLVVYETAAIALHLCDTHPKSGLAPPVGSPQRAHFYQWLMWLTNTLQATLIVYFYPERWVDAGDVAGAAVIKAHAESKVGVLLDQMDAELARHSDDIDDAPWFGRYGYSALDAYVLTLCRWTRHFESPPARTRAHLGPYLQRVLARPAVQRAIANEGLAAPWV